MSATLLFFLLIAAWILTRASCAFCENKNATEKTRLENAHSIELIKTITKQ